MAEFDIAHENQSTARHLDNLEGSESEFKYANLAVDSYPNTCSYTKQAVFQYGHPWWRQWFPYNVTFTYIEFHVHADYAANMSLFRVSVANVSDYNNKDEWPRNTLCYETQSADPPIASTSANRSVLGVFCKQPVVGNTIRIELQRKHTQLFTHIAMHNMRTTIQATAKLKLCRSGSVFLSTGRNLAYNKIVNSSTANKGAAANVNDGEETHINQSYCFASNVRNGSWLSIDFKTKVQIYQIQIQPFKANKAENLQGYCITVNDDDNTWRTIYTDTSTGGESTKEVLNMTFVTTSLKISKPFKIVLCEVKVFGDCPENRCGYDCSKECYCRPPYTLEDKIAANCPHGCLNNSRWAKGCDKVCNDTHWGEGCSEKCGHCAEGEHCNSSTGHCPGVCEPGYTNSPLCDTRYQPPTCTEDIDECLLRKDVCVNGHCNNFPGGYRCTCNTGFARSTDEKSCIDINECADVGNCLYGTCINEVGGYRCQCPPNYQLNAAGTGCVDIDECVEYPGHCGLGTCVNMPGNFSCLCPDSYMPIAGEGCIDMREDACYAVFTNASSLRRLPRCDHKLSSQVTKRQCCCVGMLGQGWGNQCEPCPVKNSRAYLDLCKPLPIKEVKHKCSIYQFLCENGRCIDTNTEEGFLCECGVGYAYNAISKRCNDTNECRTIENLCANGRCINEEGSFRCVCPSGYVLTMDGRRCIECHPSQFGHNCSQTCSRNCNSTCHHGTGHCSCQPGYRPPDCSEVCQAPHFGLNCSQTCSRNCNSTCHHVTGHCSCQPGYQLPDCNEACSKGSWGEGCNHQCGRCQESQQCDTRTGECPGACEPGYHERLCDKLTESSQFPVELVSGVSTGMLILLVALIVIVVLLMRIRKGKRTQKQNEASNVLSTVREPMSSVHDEPQQLAAAKPNTVSAQKCSPPTSAESVTTMFIQEPVYSNMQNLPPVESSGTIIALSQLQGYVMSKSVDEPLFDLEFKKIPYGLQHPATAATAPVNAGKNRYKDMLAYDHSRVVLNIVDGKEGSDYINACFIEGFFKKRAYIASQGPTEAMMDDFWRMIWQYDVSTVVMVTNLVEMGKMKCLRYWPLEVGSLEDFQALTTTLIFMEEFTDYTVRKIKLSHKDKPSVSRVVTHFHYTAWPDKDVPASTSSLLHFWRRIRAHDTDKKQPRVVHCSAGVGRTGTFIAMDILIDEGQARQTVDIYACVTKLRQQRVNMVQTASQYKYLHRLMVEYLSLRSHFVSNNELANYQNTLLQVDQKLNKTGLFLQYETEASYHTLELAEANLKGDEEDPYSVATMPENAKKNRFDAILPNNRYRAMLTVPVDRRNDYINAVYMPSYKVDNKYILTQKPLSDTVVDCWRLIESRDISLVVTFPDEGNEQDGRMFPTTGSLTVGPFNIMFITEHHEEDYFVSRVFKVQYMKKERTVTQLLYQKWPRRQMAPPNVGEFLILMDAVEKRTKSSTALIQCFDGATRSGLLLVLLYATECMSKDGEVSLPMVIRHLRTRRPQLIPNFEQYRFSYSLLTQYVESNVTYANT
ncbi:uncharacterized protein LOC127878390 [Dreissena polymorpha]|uniref:uncharacterized protein LOC127878390 n=1 Tax=Dreissena polymorpha TaxID=45954 RepID=UPI002263DC6D|nr:uncharacterized protein LOC127878390 [Dreissena polymorpha]